MWPSLPKSKPSTIFSVSTNTVAFGIDAFLRLCDAIRDPDLGYNIDVGWTLLQPGTPATALLDRLPEWRRVYMDQVSVVHVKEQIPEPKTCSFPGSSK